MKSIARQLRDAWAGSEMTLDALLRRCREVSEQRFRVKTKASLSRKLNGVQALSPDQVFILAQVLGTELSFPQGKHVP